MYLSEALLSIYARTRSKEVLERLEISGYPEIRLSLANDLNFQPIVLVNKDSEDDPFENVPLRFMNWHIQDVRASNEQGVEISITRTKPERTIEDLILTSFDMATMPSRICGYLNLTKEYPEHIRSVIIQVNGPSLDSMSSMIYFTSIDISKYQYGLIGYHAGTCYPKDFRKTEGGYSWITYDSVGQICNIYITTETMFESYTEDKLSDIKLKWKFKSVYTGRKSYTRKGAKKQKEKENCHGTSNG